MQSLRWKSSSDDDVSLVSFWFSPWGNPHTQSALTFDTGWFESPYWDGRSTFFQSILFWNKMAVGIWIMEIGRQFESFALWHTPTTKWDPNCHIFLKKILWKNIDLPFQYGLSTHPGSNVIALCVRERAKWVSFETFVVLTAIFKSV